VSLPTPHPGLVIRYAYLWSNEAERGSESASKDRPCAIVLAKQVVEGRTVVTVVPVTHTPPSHAAEAIEIPSHIKRLLGLDDQRSWVVLSEVNDFLWPGPDLVPVPGTTPHRFDYGTLPPGFFRNVRDNLIALVKEKRTLRVRRSE
jgi:PemK-like, MazF-like toxin of type II toxin-antitoxin system